MKQIGELLPDVYKPDTIPQVRELDKLKTFVDSKKAAIPRIMPKRTFFYLYGYRLVRNFEEFVRII